MRQSESRPAPAWLVFDVRKTMSIWHSIATIAEPVGAFLLAVEAIKLENFAKLQKKAVTFYRTLNPYFEFHDLASPTDRNHSATSGLIAAAAIIIVITPTTLFLFPFI